MIEPLYFSVVKAARLSFAALRIKVDVTGADSIPLTGGAVLACNHTSFLDFIFAGVPADERGHRYVRFMAKDSVFRHRIAGPLMRGMKHIPVDRQDGAASFESAVDYLNRGELVGVFPEATMSKSFDIKDCKTGAARMAALTSVPLIPQIVFGGQRMLSYHHKDFSPGKPIFVTVGKPMYPTLDDDPVEVTAELRSKLIELLDDTVERYPRSADGEDWWLPRRHGGSAPPLDS